MTNTQSSVATAPRVPFVDLKAQFRAIEEDIRTAIDRVLADASFILGPSVSDFETAFARYVNVNHCVGVSSGTAALHLALLACGVGPDDEVILPAHTFVATAWAVLYVGAKPVLVDVEPETYTIDPAAVEQAVGSKTRAVIPVHLYGQPADMDPLLELGRTHHLAIIEDAAQAHGARYKGRRCGSMGTLGCFSFYPGKNLGAYGEGGAVVANHEELAEHVRVLRNHGQRQRHLHEELGFNYRMDGLQGAVLGVKLRYLDEWIENRRSAARAYDEGLASLDGVRSLHEQPYAYHVYHLYELVAQSQQYRDDLAKHLREKAIQTGLHYPVPLHLQPALAELGHRVGDFPVAELAARCTLSLPMYPELSQEDVTYVVDAVAEWCSDRNDHRS